MAPTRSLAQPATLGRMQAEDTLWQFPSPSQASRRAHALSCSRAAMPPALPRSHNFCRERVRSASTAYRRFEPASFCVCTCLLLWLQLMGRSAGCVGARSRCTPCLSLQIYGSGAHGVCKIAGGSAAKIQGVPGVPGGSGGFLGVPGGSCGLLGS